jgi:hypothetical protein
MVEVYLMRGAWLRLSVSGITFSNKRRKQYTNRSAATMRIDDILSLRAGIKQRQNRGAR